MILSHSEIFNDTKIARGLSATAEFLFELIRTPFELHNRDVCIAGISLNLPTSSTLAIRAGFKVHFKRFANNQNLFSVSI